MFGRWRTYPVLFLAAAIALSVVPAPEHLHRPDDRHGPAIAHRHFDSHGHGRGTVADDDDVVWLRAAAVVQAVNHFPQPAAVEIAEPSGLAPIVASWYPRRISEAPPPHGPPRTAVSLRAPPASFLQLI